MRAFRTSPNAARVEWSAPSGGIVPEHFVIYYTTGNELAPLTQWKSRVTKGGSNFAELVSQFFKRITSEEEFRMPRISLRRCLICHPEE